MEIFENYFDWLVPVCVFFGEHWYGPAAFILFCLQLYKHCLEIQEKRRSAEHENTKDKE